MKPGQRDEIIQRARDIVPRLREAARQAELDRTISDAVHRDFLAAGFYRILQPRRFGGLELDLASMVDIAAELGRGCGSSAWIFTNLAVQAWVNGMKDPRAQQELWGDRPDTLASSAYPGRDARITAVDGGFEVHGTWNYSSGIDFADWINLQIFLRDEGSPPRHLFAAIPKSSCSVIDDWFVTGLAGTASRSIVIEGSFIPDYAPSCQLMSWKTSIFSCLPRSECAPTLTASISPAANRAVSSLTRIDTLAPSSTNSRASASSRSAMFTVSPMTV